MRSARPKVLHAIAGRPALSAEASDILVDRGGHRAVRALAGNPGAHLSDQTFGKLVVRAGSDAVLAEKVGRRADIPRARFVELLDRLEKRNDESSS